MFDDSCKSLCHPASNSTNDFHKTLSGRNHGVTFHALSQRSFFQFPLPFPSAAILCCMSAQPLPPATPCLYYSTLFIRCDNPELTRWCLCSLHAGIQTSPDEVVCCCDCCRYSVAEGTVYVPIRLFRQILVLAPRCSQAGALLHSSQPTSHLQPTSDRRLIFASHSATRMIPAINIILCLLCLKGRTGRAITSLRTLCFHFAVT